eukprot:9841318-Alexandrium_andersonii.AAC.1
MLSGVEQSDASRVRRVPRTSPGGLQPGSEGSAETRVFGALYSLPGGPAIKLGDPGREHEGSPSKFRSVRVEAGVLQARRSGQRRHKALEVDEPREGRVGDGRPHPEGQACPEALDKGDETKPTSCRSSRH